jgi:hypothetical protein
MVKGTKVRPGRSESVQAQAGSHAGTPPPLSAGPRLQAAAAEWRKLRLPARPGCVVSGRGGGRARARVSTVPPRDGHGTELVCRHDHTTQASTRR